MNNRAAAATSAVAHLQDERMNQITHTTYLVSVAALRAVRGSSIAKAFADPGFPAIDAEEGYGMHEEERDYTQKRPFLMWYLWTRPRGVQFCVGRNEDDSRMVVLMPPEVDQWLTSSGPTPLTDAFDEHRPATADKPECPADFAVAMVCAPVIGDVGWTRFRRCVLRFCSGDLGQYGDPVDAQAGVGRYRLSTGTLSVIPRYDRHLLHISFASRTRAVVPLRRTALYRRNS